MTLLEKIQFVLENSTAEGAAKLVHNVDQMDEIRTIIDRMWDGTKVYTTVGQDSAMKGAMIVAINNGII
jgi:hypothetical protein